MFLKYFIKLMFLFSSGFKRKMCTLFLASVIGGFLELIGIAMIFPVMLVLTSSESTGGKTILEYCSVLFPQASNMKIAFILSLIMIGVFLFKNVFMMAYIWAQNEFVRKWSDYVNNIIVRKLLYAPYNSLCALNYGDKNTLLYSIVRDISLDFVLRCIILFANGVVALCIIALLFYKFTIPAFLSTAFILLFVFFENLFFKKKARKLGDIGVKLLNDFALNVNFVINSSKEIIIANKQEYFSDYLMKSSKEISDNFSKRISYGNFPLYLTEIGVIISFLIMVTSILFLNEISKAAIVSSLAVIALMVLRLVPQLNKVLISMYAINATKKKVCWFLEKYNEISKFKIEETKDLKAVSFENEISLKNVSFQYESGLGISNINLEIKKGEFIGIIGASGAGKTTLADILSGLFSPTSGRLIIDGVEIIPENILRWRKNVSFLPQESVFMYGSIIENVAFGEKIKIDRIEEALLKAGFDPYKRNLNDDINLSSGQKKRIALARCYYRDFKVLILDEATSSLDAETENLVSENILKLKGEKTIIAIAHRLSTLKNCDRIVYLKEGKIADTGNFNELRKKHTEIDKMLRISSFD